MRGGDEWDEETKGWVKGIKSEALHSFMFGFERELGYILVRDRLNMGFLANYGLSFGFPSLVPTKFDPSLSYEKTYNGVFAFCYNVGGTINFYPSNKIVNAYGA